MPNFKSVGFQHVLQDAWAVLSGKELSRERQHYVLQEVFNWCSAALLGVRLISEQVYFIRTEERPALEWFSFFDQFLNRGYGRTWVSRLRATAATLEALLCGQIPNATHKEVASTLLRELSDCVRLGTCRFSN